jgi:DNA polymerase III alpha subunit (gram-positive type)
MDGIKADKDKLNKDYQNGLITPENYNSTLNQLNDLEKETSQTAKTVADNYKRVNAEFVQSCQLYLQEALNSFNTIMNAVWDAQDVQFDKEQEALDKENEMLQEKLDKQQEIIEEHKNAVDSIEDELATARGDRRQHLIDQLNAEMEAQRAAQIEEQKIQKEKEKNERKQEALEKERKKAEYKRNLIQAIVNGAMAVTYAAMNTWPIPAIPMMALAGATTAAQIAIMAANKPYAKGGQLDGGVAVGNRHRDGGIKVLGGRAEIEGGEFITNRISTQMNAPLLEFINSKKKRIDASDLIEFYSSGSVKKNIAKVKTKFEDGGYIPTLPNELDVRDQLQNVIINQDNRPIYVSVVDINNKQDDVRRVQTLAGL